MKEELWLVKLPKIENLDQDFYGIGYYREKSFVFSLLTPDCISNLPLREIDHDGESEFSIIHIDRIIDLPFKDLKR